MISRSPGRQISEGKHWLAWTGMSINVLGFVGVIWLLATGCGFDFGANFFSTIPGGVGFTVIGALIAYYRPENRIGRLCLLIGFLQIVGLAFVDLYARCGLIGGLALPGAAYVAWLRFLFLPGMLACFGILLPNWFPDGRFLSPRWAFLGWSSLILLAAFTLAAGLLPGPLENRIFRFSYPVDNPLGLFTLPDWLGAVIYDYVNLPLVAGILIAVLSLVVRWRRSDGVARQQIKWLAYFLVMLVVIQVVGFELLAGLFYRELLGSALYRGLNVVFQVGFPLVVGVTVFRHRLYDIDLIIRRTLVYSLLTAIFASLYLGSVVLLQALFSNVSGAQSAPSIVLSTLFIAALFSPVRARVQAVVDRRFYRHKYDAAQTLAQFAEMARDEMELETLKSELAQVLIETMQPEQVSIWLLTDLDAQLNDEEGMDPIKYGREKIS